MDALFPDQRMHVIGGVLVLAVTIAVAFSLWRVARGDWGVVRLITASACVVALVAGTVTSVGLFRWRPGVPDVINASGGTYEWGSGWADSEPPGGGCESLSHLTARGFGTLKPAGRLTGEHFANGEWVAGVGADGSWPVYRTDVGTLVVRAGRGCYVAFTEMA